MIDKPTSREIIERLVRSLGKVEYNTNYGIHDSDYCIPFGTEGYIPSHMTEPCTCALCVGREYLARADGLEAEEA